MPVDIPNRSLLLYISIAAIIGFALPILWLGVSFLFFTAKQSVWTDFYGHLILITCPPWKWGIPLPLIPFANAAVYTLLLTLVVGGRRLLVRSLHKRP